MFTFHVALDSKLKIEAFCCQVKSCCHYLMSVDGLCDDFVSITRGSTFSPSYLIVPNFLKFVSRFLGYDQSAITLTGRNISVKRIVSGCSRDSRQRPFIVAKEVLVVYSLSAQRI
jgi:hypothetical protein